MTDNTFILCDGEPGKPGWIEVPNPLGKHRSRCLGCPACRVRCGGKPGEPNPMGGYVPCEGCRDCLKCERCWGSGRIVQAGSHGARMNACPDCGGSGIKAPGWRDDDEARALIEAAKGDPAIPEEGERVERYSLTKHRRGNQLDPNRYGEWVRFADYAAAEARAKQAEERAEQLAARVEDRVMGEDRKCERCGGSGESVTPACETAPELRICCSFCGGSGIEARHELDACWEKPGTCAACAPAVPEGGERWSPDPDLTWNELEDEARERIEAAERRLAEVEGAAQQALRFLRDFHSDNQRDVINALVAALSHESAPEGGERWVV